MFWILACTPPDDAPPPSSRSEWRVEGAALVDPDGQQVILHGVNARIEGLFDVSFSDGRIALETIPPFGQEDCRFLAEELGFNSLRMPVNWSGIEPERGNYSDDYLERVTTLVDDCAAVGISSIVDLHQDAYSKEIGEDGAPLWAIIPTPEELLEGPLEDLAERRTSPAVLAAFTSLYTDVDGLIQAYADMAAELATRLKDHPGAIALELHNEPVPLGRLDELDEFHDRVATAVRAAHPSLLIAFEPDSFRNLTDAAPVNTPFPHANSLYAPHLYVDVFESSPGTTEAIQDSVAGMVEEAEAHGAALWVGEFGADPKTEEGMRYIQDSLDSLDAARVGWAFWVYEEWGQGRWGLYESSDDVRGALREDLADLLARPYPIAVDGRLQAMSWDGSRLSLSLTGAGKGTHTLATAARIFGTTATVRCDGVEETVPVTAGRVRVACEGETLELLRP